MMPRQTAQSEKTRSSGLPEDVGEIRSPPNEICECCRNDAAQIVEG